MRFTVLSLVLVLPIFAQAQLFTSTEVKMHNERIDQITSVAAGCLVDTYEDHVSFYKRWGVSKYYGDRKPEYSSVAGRKAALAKYGAPESLVNELEGISCIGLTMRCLSKGFDAAGMTSTWQKIYGKLSVDRKFYGTDLIAMLRELGWKTQYWNPDITQNAAWDLDDQTLNPLKPGQKWNAVWGGHAYNYAMVLKKGTYYGIPVDDKVSLVNFGRQMPSSLRGAPLFVGVAHAGYHVFPGIRGQVIEAHSMRNLNAFDNLEVSDFNPLGTGGGPRWTRTEKYRSGLIVVPPNAR